MESLESPLSQRLRYKLVIGKFRVVHVEEKGAMLEWAVEFPGLGVMKLLGPKADVREGDLLTFYTEILAPERRLDA